MDVREKLVELLTETPGIGWSPSAREIIVDHLIARGVTVQEWISVKDRLPQEKGEICKNVILFMDDGLVTVGWLNEDRGSAYMLDTRNDFISKVPMLRCTHWMPLPQPLKGE